MTADPVLVCFSGHGAGAGELSWGQQTIWRTMVESNSSIIQGELEAFLRGMEDVLVEAACGAATAV